MDMDKLRQIDTDFKEAYKTNVVKFETWEIDNFNKCEGHVVVMGETDFVDHKIEKADNQEENEKKFYVKKLNPEGLYHPYSSKKISTIESNIVHFKSEDGIDIFHQDIKCETSAEESARFCEMCYQSFEKETDFFKSTSYISECSCQQQSEPPFFNIYGEDLTLDMPPTSLGLSTDSRLQQLEVQPGEEVTNKQDASLEPWRLSITLIENGNEMQRKFCSKALVNNLPQGHLKGHESRHSGEKAFNCTICAKAFSYASNLKDHHVKFHTGKKPYQCKICLESCRQMVRLKLHEGYDPGKKTFQFQRCSKVSTNLGNTEETIIICKICFKSFRQIGHLKVHVAEKPFRCTMCTRSFEQVEHLNAHEVVHFSEKPFCCKICSKSFRCKSSFKIHERVHTGAKPFHCKISPKCFSRTEDLKDHERAHLGETPYFCKICSKYFGQLSSLKEHERVHTGEKPFQCKICLKSFAWSRYLKVHDRAHTGEKSFQCKICSKSFVWPSSLKSHERAHADEKLKRDIEVLFATK